MVDQAIIGRFEKVIGKGNALMTEHRIERGIADFIEPAPFAEWRSQSLALLSTVFGARHPYTTEFEKVTAPESRVPDKWNAEGGTGVLKAAVEDYASGQMWTLRELVHADVFDDYLEMAESLLASRHETAAAVIAGTTLEEHLRKLCQKHNVPVNKKASVMNDNLHKQTVYLQADWRLNQGWLDVRNDCAHNLSTGYQKAQIQQMIDGIRDFMARNPA